MKKFWYVMNVPVGTNVANVPFYATTQDAAAAAIALANANYAGVEGYKQVVVVLEVIKVIKPPAVPAPAVVNPDP